MSNNVSTCTSLDSFISEISHIVESETMFEESVFLFRGESKDYGDTRLTPTVFRNAGYAEDEDQIYRYMIMRYPHEFSEHKSTLENLVHMAHYGAPTRLLDFSFNPLVALYFAVSGNKDNDGYVYLTRTTERNIKGYHSDTISVVTGMAKLTSAEKRILVDDAIVCLKELLIGIGLIKDEIDLDTRRFLIECPDLIVASHGPHIDEFNSKRSARRLLYHIASDKPHFSPQIRPEHVFGCHFVKPMLSNRRILAQSGAFLVCSNKVIVNQCHSITIPASFKEKIKNTLELCGVSHGTMYPEIDNCKYDITTKFGRTPATKQ